MFKKVDLINGPILKSIIIFSFPLFVSYLFQIFYNTVDTFIIGRYLGDNSLAAIGSVGAVYDLLIGFATGIGTGLSIVISRYFGKGDNVLLKKSIATCLVIGFGMAVLIAFVGYYSLNGILTILKTPSDIFVEAYGYISIVIIFSVFIFAYNLFSSILRSVGDSFRPLIFLIFSSLLNIVLDYYFIAKLNMGIKGAAIATVIAQGVSAILSILYILNYRKNLVPTTKDYKLDKDMTIEMTLQGLSMGFMSSIVSLGSVILQYGINSLGTLIIAAHQAARKVYIITMLPIMGIGLAMPTFVGQNAGANKYLRIRKGLLYTFALDIVLALIITVFTFIFGRDLIALISSSQEEIILNNAYYYILVAAPFYSVLGILVISRNSLQALGLKVVPLISSIIECLGKIVFCLFFVPLWGYNAVIFCEPIIWCLMCAQLVYTLFRYEKIAHAEDAVI